MSTPGSTNATGAPGALILGGAHGTIALARALRAEGHTVWLVTDDTPLPRFSNAIARTFDWPGSGSAEGVGFLLDLAEAHGLEGWVLIPAADGDVRFASRNHAALSRAFHVLVPEWLALEIACDKGLAYRRAMELGLAVPTIHRIDFSREGSSGGLAFPVVIKPAMRLGRNRLTLDKAWRADDEESFARLYREAVELVGAEQVVVQELVPGDGNHQLSYAGLWWHGEPVVDFTARRARQFPLEFSYTSTYVETAETGDVCAAAHTFLRSIGHHGLVEVEFKRDERSGVLKLLDINPRPWSWLALASVAGVDFGKAIAALMRGETVPAMRARQGVGWLFLTRDVVAAWQMVMMGKLSAGAYLASLGRVRVLATLDWRDPRPGLIEIPLTLLRAIKRRRALKRK